MSELSVYQLTVLSMILP